MASHAPCHLLCLRLCNSLPPLGAMRAMQFTLKLTSHRRLRHKLACRCCAHSLWGPCISPCRCAAVWGWERGCVLCGVSSWGAMCWGSGIRGNFELTCRRLCHELAYAP